MSSDIPEDPESIGYRQPPRRTRFKPGQSGNPNGRPKAVKSLKQLISRELDRKVFLTEEGRRKRASKREVFAKQIVKDALSGNVRARETVLNLDQEVAETVTRVTGALLKPGDDRVKANLLVRLRAALDASNGEGEQ